MQDAGNTLLLLRSVQALIAIALLALLGQGALRLVVRAFGQDPGGNACYRLLAMVVAPVTRACRWIAPSFVADRHVPLVAVCLLSAGYLWTMAAIADTCQRVGLPIAQCLQR